MLGGADQAVDEDKRMRRPVALTDKIMIGLEFLLLDRNAFKDARSDSRSSEILCSLRMRTSQREVGDKGTDLNTWWAELSIASNVPDPECIATNAGRQKEPAKSCSGTNHRRSYWEQDCNRDSFQM